jgi:RNA 2',3'-cyclic 3'-phosphodiesterase
MRLFLALDIDDEIRERIALFLDGVREFAPDVRWVRPESLHVTLKFIGEKPEEAVDEMKQALSEIKTGPLDLTFRGHGFFPGAKAARVFWIGIGAGPQLASLAKTLDETVVRLGVPKDEHAFSPHLTLARGGGQSGAPPRRKEDRPNLRFVRLQEKLAARSTPEFGTMTAREFCLYKSQLSSGGSRYTKIARFPLQ